MRGAVKAPPRAVSVFVMSVLVTVVFVLVFVMFGFFGFFLHVDPLLMFHIVRTSGIHIHMHSRRSRQVGVDVDAYLAPYLAGDCRCQEC